MKANLTLYPVNDSIEKKLKDILVFLYGVFSSVLPSRERTLKSTSKPPYDLCSDAELIDMVRSGDEKAFEHIYRSYVQHLYRFAKKNITCHEDCEEIIQDIFLSLWERHQSLRITTIKFYLLTCVRYSIIAYIRRKKLTRRYAEHFRLFEAVYDTMPEAERDVDTFSSLLEKGIAQLPPRCQSVIKLRLSDDLSNGEIAKRLKISRRTVENHFYKAFNILRTFCLKAT